MKLVLGKNFPSEPPKGFFLTTIFHPNVAKNGEICVNTLKKDWKAALGIKHVLLVSYMIIYTDVTSLLSKFNWYFIVLEMKTLACQTSQEWIGAGINCNWCQGSHLTQPTGVK